MMIMLDMKEYRFIRDDIFLCPQIDSKTGEMWVVLKKVDLNTGKVLLEDKLFCSHTVVTEITDEEFWKYANDIEYNELLKKSVLKIRSGGELKEVVLSLEDNFFALNSWVEGISLAGIDGLKIQGDIEEYSGLLYPMVNWLHRFMAKADSEFIPGFLAKIERECMFEGEKHEPSLIANLVPLMKAIAISSWENEWECPDRSDGYFVDEITGYYIKDDFKDFLGFINNLVPLEKLIDDMELLNRILYLLEADNFKGKWFFKKEAQFLRDFDNVYNHEIKFIDLTGVGEEEDYFLHTQSDKIVVIQDQHITGLVFDRCELKIIPESIGNLNHLEFLNFYSNKIEKLPESIGTLENLRVLKIGYNLFKKIPENFKNLVNLEYLDFSGLKLGFLPEWISLCKNLSNLGACDMDLKEIPEWISNLSKLGWLELSWNPITKIPDFLGEMPTLREIEFIQDEYDVYGGKGVFVEIIVSQNVFNKLNYQGNISYAEYVIKTP